MNDDTTPGPDLREQIAEAVMTWHNARITMCEHTQLVSFGEAAVAVLAVVQPDLDRAREMANILLSKMNDTRTALVSLDQAISGIGGGPEEAEVRAAYDDLVATLGLPKEER